MYIYVYIKFSNAYCERIGLAGNLQAWVAQW